MFGIKYITVGLLDGVVMFGDYRCVWSVGFEFPGLASLFFSIVYSKFIMYKIFNSFF